MLGSGRFNQFPIHSSAGHPDPIKRSRSFAFPLSPTSSTQSIDHQSINNCCSPILSPFSISTASTPCSYLWDASGVGELYVDKWAEWDSSSSSRNHHGTLFSYHYHRCAYACSFDNRYSDTLIATTHYLYMFHSGSKTPLYYGLLTLCWRVSFQCMLAHQICQAIVFIAPHHTISL